MSNFLDPCGHLSLISFFVLTGSVQYIVKAHLRDSLMFLYLNYAQHLCLLH